MKNHIIVKSDILIDIHTLFFADIKKGRFTLATRASTNRAVREEEEKKRREKEEELNKLKQEESQIEALIQRTAAIERKVQVMPPDVVASLAEQHNIFMVTS